MNRQEIATLANRTYISFQIDELLPAEKYEIYIQPSSGGASWRYHNDRHLIFLGEQVLDHISEDLTNQDKQHAIYAYLFHEFAHSLWTDKDIRSIIALLETKEIPFPLFNLFEDARIEEKMRHHLQRKFNWLKFEPLEVPKKPVEMLFYIIQCEHKPDVLGYAKKQMSEEEKNDFDTVFSLYKQALKASSTMQVIPVLEQWFEHFDRQETEEELTSMQSQEELLLQECNIMLATLEAIDELIKELENILESTPLDNAAPDDARSHELTYMTMESWSNTVVPYKKNTRTSKLLADQPIPCPFDSTKANQLYQQMEKLFFAPVRHSNTTIPRKRINIKGLAQGSQKLFKERSRTSQKLQTITIILDVSGSMSDIIEDMRLVLHVINILTQRNIIRCHLILSGVDDDIAKFQRLNMPLKPSELNRIVPLYEGEGLVNAFYSNQKLLKQSDYVWVFTDGITDETLNKKVLHQLGITTHAMYIGNKRSKPFLERSFDHVICEESVEGLAEQVFTLIRE